MPRHADSGQLDLAAVFRRAQGKMLGDLTLGRVFEHGTASGQQWLEFVGGVFAAAVSGGAGGSGGTEAGGCGVPEDPEEEGEAAGGSGLALQMPMGFVLTPRADRVSGYIERACKRLAQARLPGTIAKNWRTSGIGFTLCIRT